MRRGRPKPVGPWSRIAPVPVPVEVAVPVAVAVCGVREGGVPARRVS